MNYPSIHSAGKAPAISDYHVVAFYHPETGAIRHLHTVTVFAGGRAVDEAEAVRRAHEKATAAGHNLSRLKFKVSKDPEHGHRPHRIDLKTGHFVAAPLRPGPPRPKDR